MTGTTSQWIATVVATAISAIALIGQCAFEQDIAYSVETRELIVRDPAGGPAIEARADPTGLTLQFVDGPERPVVFAYTTRDRDSHSTRPSSELAIRVDDDWAGIVATAGNSRVSLAADRSSEGAQLALSDRNGAARLASSETKRGITAWTRTEPVNGYAATGPEPSRYSWMELTADRDAARLRLASGLARFDAEGKTDGTASVHLSSGGAFDPPRASLVTTREGSTFSLRDADNKTPIELSSGDKGSIRLLPGPAGCVNLNSRGHGC